MDSVETIKLYRSMAKIRETGGAMEREQAKRFNQIADWLDELVRCRIMIEILKYGI